MPLVYIGIGSNVGSRKTNCVRAIELLGHSGISVLRQSSFHETEPWGITEQPKFINAAVQAETDRSPADLMKALKDIEKIMGRAPGPRWGPRLIDLDILIYDGLVLRTAGLEIPHPRMHERLFVMKPLAEIAPDLVHPVLGKSIKELLEELEK